MIGRWTLCQQNGGCDMAIVPDSMLGVVTGTVTDKFAYFEQLSSRYNSLLDASLSSIGNIKVDEVATPTRPLAPVASSPTALLGNAPVFHAPNLSMPEAPQLADIDAWLSKLDIDASLALPDMPALPSVQIPDAPVLANSVKPARPDVDMDIVIPAAPDFVLPDVPTLEQIHLPDFVFPQLPDFNGNPPSVDGIAVPDVFINWVEPEYKSEILPDLVAQVRLMMAGGTGLPAAIEDALFARSRERGSAESERAVQEVVNAWAARGYSLPQGVLDKQIAVVREQGRLQAAELNRDILVQAAQWEIENLRFAVQQGLALEQLTSNLFENMAARLFDVAKFSAESQIGVFNARIGLFNAQNAAFETIANVYRVKVEAELSKLTAYKAAVEGQLAIGEINKQYVDVYRARLDGLQASTDLYKTMMSAAQIRADVLSKQFDAYRTDVQAYAESINAEKLKFDAYDARLSGEKTKADIFDSQVRAYATTVQAVANQADVRVKEGQLQLSAAEMKVKKFAADLDGYKAQMQASLSQAQYSTQVFQAQVEAWKANSSSAVAEAEMQSRFADMNTRTNIAYAEMQISEYQAKMQNAISKAQIALDAAKALGQFTAQLAAGALSAVHVSAGMSASGSVSSSESKSTSTSHNYSY